MPPPPPPPPLPPRLAPTTRRSRALWDEARKPGASSTALLRAILYELQPIRLSSIQWTKAGSSETRENGIRTVQRLVGMIGRSLLGLIVGTFHFVKSWSRREWMIVLGCIFYFYIVRFLHRLLDAGPMIIILSALVLIFTVGLSDETEQNDGSPNRVSAYSVFNRGFQRILGSIDVESLVAQHVGGALAFHGMRARQEEQQEEEEEDDWRRMNNRAAAARGNVAGPPGNVAVGGNFEGNERNIGPPGIHHPRQEREQARKSGKKARRRNLELRREMQRQRQAAAAMGFAGDGNLNEMAAMNRLVEDQVAAIPLEDDDEAVADEDFGIELEEAGFDG